MTDLSANICKTVIILLTVYCFFIICISQLFKMGSCIRYKYWVLETIALLILMNLAHNLAFNKQTQIAKVFVNLQHFNYNFRKRETHFKTPIIFICIWIVLMFFFYLLKVTWTCMMFRSSQSPLIEDKVCLVLTKQTHIMWSHPIININDLNKLWMNNKSQWRAKRKMLPLKCKHLCIWDKFDQMSRGMLLH